MTTLLHVAASPRRERSESLALADEFLTVYADRHPDHQVETWNLWDSALPEFGTAAAQAKMAVFAGASPRGEAAAAWRTAEATFRRFAAADKYLFSVPMWNHGVPYILKQLIDVISQPGMVFTFDPERGYTGLLGRPHCRGHRDQRGVRPRAPAPVRQRLPAALLARLAGLGRHPARRRRAVPAEPGHRRRRKRSREIARADARDVAKRF